VDTLLEAAWKEIAGKVRLKPDPTPKTRRPGPDQETVDLIGAARRSARARRKA
jgi:hypothetical protein